MADIADRAAEAEEIAREDALARHKGVLAHPDAWQTASAKWCVELVCGERIPDERRRAIPGVQRCVDCQGRREKKKR